MDEAIVNAIAVGDRYTRHAAVRCPWPERGLGKKLSRLYEELNRRRVFRTIVAYVVLVWLLSQGAADLFPAFGLSDGAVRIFVIGALAMIPVVGLLSWHFDITPSGVKPDRFSDPGMLADEDLTPENAAEWARNRHEPQPPQKDDAYFFSVCTTARKAGGGKGRVQEKVSREVLRSKGRRYSDNCW